MGYFYPTARDFHRNAFERGTRAGLRSSVLRDPRISVRVRRTPHGRDGCADRRRRRRRFVKSNTVRTFSTRSRRNENAGPDFIQTRNKRILSGMDGFDVPTDLFGIVMFKTQFLCVAKKRSDRVSANFHPAWILLILI